VVVQNFKVQATGQYGIDSRGTHITIQNNDIKNVHASGDGDLNAIKFFGDHHSILYNTAIDFVSGDANDSHTDAIQTWNSDPGDSSSYVVIQNNYFSGPLEDDGSSYISPMRHGRGCGLDRRRWRRNRLFPRLADRRKLLPGRHEVRRHRQCDGNR
jgi:hypothetical protein